MQIVVTILGSVIVYLDDKRRPFADLVSKIQHACAGIPLLIVGIQKLREGVELPIAILEIAIAAAVLVTFALELRAFKRRGKHAVQHHSPVGWFDIARESCSSSRRFMASTTSRAIFGRNF